MALSIPVSVPATYDVLKLRAEQFPLTKDTIFLTHAGISPLPKRTVTAMQNALEQLMLDPANFDRMMDSMTAFPKIMAELINAADPSEIVGVQSTSLGLNLAAHAIPWGRGQNVVLCDVEFPSNVYPWTSLKDSHGVEARFVSAKSDGGLTLEAVKGAVDGNTRLVTASAFQFLTGHRADLMAIGAFCHERGILFAVDAIQAAGHTPIDVQAMHIDILCSGGQKSLMGPAGQGFLYVKGDLCQKMIPSLVSCDGVEDPFWWLHYDMTPRAGAARFGMGTFNYVGTVGLMESVTMLRELGIAGIDSYVTSLSDYLIGKLKDAGYEVITPAAHGPIVTFGAAPTDEASEAIRAGLAKKRIFVAKHWDSEKNTYLRASMHCYNTVEDLDRFLSALQEIK